MLKIFTDNTKDWLGLKAGQQVLLSGVIYTARDQAHKRLVEAVNSGRNLPLSLQGKVIYYCGPTSAKRGAVIGSCGPTTSARMDIYTPVLLEEGVKALIGKGRRSRQVRLSLKEHKALYFLAPAGCGALLTQNVIQRKLVAFKDLGPEAIYELEVKDFPLIVGIDSHGRGVYGDL